MTKLAALAPQFRRLRLGPVLVVALALLGEAAAVAQGFLNDSTLQLRNAVIAVQLDPELEPVALLRAGRVFRDYQTRGFLRIGALPMVVIDKLSIELRNADRLSSVLTSVGEKLALRTEAKKAVEGRDFRLSFSSSKGGQLRAHRVRLEKGTEWQLLDGVVERPGTTNIVFSQATLTVAGPGAGELVCETADGVLRVHLLSVSAPAKKELSS